MGIYTIIIVTGLTAYFAVATSNGGTSQECQDRMAKDSDTECCVLKTKHVQPFNKNTHLCCDWDVHRHSPNWQCCSHPTKDESVYYDQRKKMCCGGKLHDNKDDNALECCGDKLYSNKTQLCCQIDHQMQMSFRVFEKESTAICPIYYCNKEPYDVTKKICCNGKILSIVSNHVCCGSKLYDQETHVCCNDRKHLKRRYNKGCCGKIYLRGGQNCCGEKLIKQSEKCCGGKTYNARRHKCTADLKIVPIETPLCHNREYNPKTQVCCGYFAMTKRNEDDNACCKPRGHKPGTTFNNKNMTCDNGEIRSTVTCNERHTPDKYTCCNNYAYSQPADNSVCCEGKAEWYKPGLDQENCRPPLCHGEWYNDNVEDCCDNKLIKIHRSRCIDQKAYRYYDREDNLFSNLRICGRYAISNSYRCCAGVMPYKHNHYSCPLSDFGNETPIKPPKFPFWPIIKCRSKELSGRIIDTVKNSTRITVVLREKKSRKHFILNISSKQEWKITNLKDRKAFVNVYYEESIENELFLGEYGAIERRGRRRQTDVDSSICGAINTFFETSSI